MKLTFPILAVLALASATTPVVAEDSPSPSKLPERLQPYDIDGNGRLSIDEWRAFIDDHKPDLPPNPIDTDGDGQITREEIEAFREKIRQRIEDERRKRFEEADTDDDGSLSLEEFTASLPALIPATTAERLFNHCDADDDGAISEEEFLNCLGRPARPIPTRPPKPPIVPKPPLPDFLKPFDLNGDGVLSRDEIEKAIRDHLWPLRP